MRAPFRCFLNSSELTSGAERSAKGVRLRRQPPDWIQRCAHSYVEELERRVAQLEAQLQRSEAPSPSAQACSSPQHMLKSTFTVSEELKQSTKGEAHSDDNYYGRSAIKNLFGSCFAFRCAATGRSDPLVVRLELSVLRWQRAQRSDQLTDQEILQPSFFDRVVQSEGGRHLAEHPLPDDELVTKLIDVYYAGEGSTTPMIPRWLVDKRRSDSAVETDAGFRSLLFAIMARAALFSDDPRGLESAPWIYDAGSAGTPDSCSRGYAWFIAACRLALAEPIDIYRLVALPMLVCYAMDAGSLNAAWLILGFAGRFLLASGGHCEESETWNKTFLQDELRKRIFWCASLLFTLCLAD